MIVLWVTLWILLGLVIGYLVADRRARTAQTEHAIAREQTRQTSVQLSELQSAFAVMRDELAAAQRDRATLDAQLAAEKTTSSLQREHLDGARRQIENDAGRYETLSQQHAGVHQERAGLAAQLVAEKQTVAEVRQFLDESRQLTAAEKAKLEAINAQLIDLQNRHAGTVARLDAERAALTAERQHFSDTKNRLSEAFKDLSGEALQKNNASFLALADSTFKKLQSEAAGGLEEKKAQIGALLQPVSAQLEGFKQSVDKLEATRGEAFTQIQRELAAVAATQQHLSIETKQLVNALRRPEGRGRWGEVALERLFEASGMSSHVIYNAQETMQTDDGDNQRPDVIITLPKNRRVIVDSKAVFAAFLDAVDCTDDVARVEHMSRHVKQVRSRVDDLSSKAYWKTAEHTTEFVIMFLPIEAQLYAAVERDRGLVEYALHKRVLIASPTTLMGVLQVLEHSWQQDQVEENARKIVEAAKTLYERLAKVSKDFDRLGRALGSATNAYNDTLASIETRLLPQARKIAKMGLSKKAELSAGKMLDVQVRDIKTSVWPTELAAPTASAEPTALADRAEPAGDADGEPDEADGPALAELTLAETAALGAEAVRSAEA